jgi:tetratricopeptide (TPR) repeat protein
VVQYRLGRYREAADCYGRALELDPAFADARANRAAALQNLQAS